ncbi:MAG TPA: HepT-like ribonuclease domain-containing protein [Kineosporiaceae bacterium]|nr:HepT-like ribonuclease domain-containing protein [Kineosporiaceae bacterium]
MRRDLLLLEEMIAAAEQACALVAGVSAADLAEDRMRRDALLWNFTVLGEAAGQLSVATRERFDGVPWRQPTRLRNRIVRGYWSIDLEVVHTTAELQLPGLVAELRQVLAQLVDEDASGQDQP